jgi:hypothetical protein
VVYGGKDSKTTTPKCTKNFDYTVGATDDAVVAGYKTRKQRYCIWCTATLDTDNYVLLKDYKPPATADRLLKGIVVLTADDKGAINLATEKQTTVTKMNAVAIGSGGCGKAGQTTKKSTAGQLVEFTMKSPVDLAAGQYVFWEDSTLKLKFALDGTLPAKSVSCTCGSNSFEATLDNT